MNPEEKKPARNASQSEAGGEDNSKEFGKVIDALHSKQKLSSLRSYQGDMAEFIKSKDESVVSIVVKEKERKERKEKEELEVQKEAQKIEPTSKSVSHTSASPVFPASHPVHSSPTRQGSGFQMNLTMLLLSILLIGGGALASIYIFDFIKKEPQAEVVLKEDIIPYNNTVTLANITKENLGSELAKLSLNSGVSILKISDSSGASLLKAKDFFNFLKVSLPSALERTLKDDYVVGVSSQNKENSYFLVIKVNDFGQAFSAMLDWEGNMSKDLAFLNNTEEVLGVATSSVATTTTTITSTTTTNIKIPLKPEVFVWKDLIIKNKDTRGLVNEKGKSKLAYAFLDKNTILITNNLSAIGEISSIYASRSVAR
jgi:hypothetical protein